MFYFALLLGIFHYLIFFLGLLGWLYRDIVVWLTVLFWGAALIWKIKEIRGVREIRVFKKQKLLLVFVVLFFLQSFVNLIGALGPELGFDALWYHLTLPKIYLQNHSIFFIPGGLLYYSAMPKLAEMLYIAGLSFGNETLPKLIHFSFGLLTCLALYKLQRKFFNPLVSFIGIVIFYSNLVVSWQSITAYIDLIRAFFEVMSLWAFVNWIESNKHKWLIWSALMLGFAITTKLLAIGSLMIFSFLFLWKIRRVRTMREIGMFVLISLLIPTPWFIFSYINTGNPVYPFFTNIYPVAAEPISLIGFVREVWILFTQSADPISPVYLIFLPLIILFWRRIREIRVIGVYSILAVIIWYFTPRTGGGRFILPYLPAMSIICSAVFFEILKNYRLSKLILRNFLIGIIIFISCISLGYRLVANTRYTPFILGYESKEKFLAKNLNFAFGDFYDIDGFFKNKIKPSDKVLLYGFHNLYYVDFPFVDSSWMEEIRRIGKIGNFNYIATQNAVLPQQYKSWKLVYKNEKTMVKLYKK